ncbi:hypothetical protein [Luteimonas sp. A482]
MTRKTDTPPQADKPEREQREYPHGSGDRNSFSPFGKDRMPIHEGGSQRQAPPDPEAEGDKDTPSR